MFFLDSNVLLFSNIIFNAFVRLSLNKYCTIILTKTNTSAIPPVMKILKVASEYDNIPLPLI